MKRFRIAQVGVGNRGRATLAAFSKHPERVDIVAACDINPENVQRAANQFNIPAHYQSVEDLIQQADFEVASVTTATPVRQAVIQPLLEAGVHVIADKPFAETLDEARAIVACAEANNRRIAVGQNFRYLHGFDTARQYLADLPLGQPRHLTHLLLGTRQDRGWRAERERRVMAIMTIHWFDGYRWMLDDLPETIYCQTSKSPLIDGRGETHTSLTIRFQNGCVASLTESFGSHRRTAIPPILDCDEGSLEITGAELRVYETGISEPVRVIPATNASMEVVTYMCLADLLDAIEADREPPNSGQDNLKTMAMMEGAYRSAEANRVVHWEELGVL
ncbi:MAG: Gfo/Idh/MocA family oxidoreductase [Candidatus Poribacteria bacterium]|nr:Gfo/Idh/MocA family oxidoreductase [Candidatus Poribacteria bacterium]